MEKATAFIIIISFYFIFSFFLVLFVTIVVICEKSPQKCSVGISSNLNCIRCYAEDGLTVDLQGCRLVKLHSDMVTLKNRYDVGMLDMLAFEDGGEYHQRFELAAIMINHCGNGAVPAFLVGGRDHAAAVVSAEHRRSKPNLLEAVNLAVDGNLGVDRLEVKQKTFDRARGVIDRFIGRFAHFVADLTAITVDPVSDAVDELVVLAVDGNGRQVAEVAVQRDQLALLLPYAGKKIITCAGRKEIDLVFESHIGCIVDEAIQSTVAAGEDQFIVIG